MAGYPKQEQGVNTKKCVCSGAPCPKSSLSASSKSRTKKDKGNDKDKGKVKRKCTNATCKCKRKKKKSKKEPKSKSKSWDFYKPCKSGGGGINTGLWSLLSPLCFPCSTIWRLCTSSTSTTNDCLLYWLCSQWILCKLERGCSLDQVLFPYYVYLFAQIMLFGFLLYLFWHMFGKSIILPLIYSTKMYMEETAAGRKKYCFARKDLFPDEYKKAFPNGPPPSSGGLILKRTNVETLVMFIFEFFFVKLLF